MAWSDHLEDPIMLPAGITLRTLSEAARYIQRLPATEAHKPHWQTACGILIDAAEGRDFVMHARIAMLRAVNHGLPPPEQPPRRKAVKAFRIIR
jgi:hypothetical protein